VYFPLDARLLEEARRFNLRSACEHCLFFIAQSGACAHEWPNEDQRHWPLDKPRDDGTIPTEAPFCKEFELR
jgi:hypothetical protein